MVWSTDIKSVYEDKAQYQINIIYMRDFKMERAIIYCKNRLGGYRSFCAEVALAQVWILL